MLNSVFPGVAAGQHRDGVHRDFGSEASMLLPDFIHYKAEVMRLVARDGVLW